MFYSKVTEIWTLHIVSGAKKIPDWYALSLILLYHIMTLQKHS